MIYLLGGSGYVGQAYQALLARRGIPFRSLSRAETDYANPAVLGDALRRDRPEFLINAAGYAGKPNLDACELHKSECLLGNAVLPGVVARACAEAGVPWGHVSSGCIYDGTGPGANGFVETDTPNFTFRTNRCSFYSGSKALGEEILAGRPDLYVWRLRLAFDNVDNPRNYLTKIMRYERLLAATNSISQLHEFAAATYACWEKRTEFGTYNVTNPGRVTTQEVAELIRASGVSAKKVVFFKDDDEFVRIASKTPRPQCVLDSGKLARTGIHLTEIHEAIARALHDWKKS